MRILLIGEYSNMHNTLATALRKFGHEVVVVSDGDGWKNYKRDIDVSRKDGFWGGMALRWRLMRKILPQLKGFDVVHLINPQWLDVDPSLTLTLNEYLKQNNRLFSLGLYGDDYYVLKGQAEGVLEYSDTHCYGTAVNEAENAERIEKWTVQCRDLCEKTVAMADCLVANLYEYHKLYAAAGFGQKLYYIGTPIEFDDEAKPRTFDSHVHILIGQQTKRAVVKGTDILVPFLDRVDNERPHHLKINKVSDMPFDQYKSLLKEADVLVDQLYSYTPATNALEAMKHGTVVISGGEEEYYDFIGEEELRPVINLRPYRNLENLDVLNEVLFDNDILRKKSAESIAFVKKYHDADKIAKEYINVWSERLAN